MCNRNLGERYAWSRSNRRQNFPAPEFTCRVLCPSFFGLEFVVDRSVQKCFLVKALAGSVLMSCLAVQSHAAGLVPGKWRSDYRVQINGKDSTVVMSQFAAQVGAAMPTDLKAGSKVSVSSIGNQGSATVCMTPAVASALTSPTSVFNKFAKTNPRCTLVAGQVVGDTVSFTGRCDDPFTYTGNVSGTVRVPNSWTWWANMQGVGRFPDAVLIGLHIPAQSLVTMKTTMSSTLISKICQ